MSVQVRLSAAAIVGAATLFVSGFGVAQAAPAPMPSPATDHRVPFGEGRATMHYPRYHEYQLDAVKVVSSFDEVKGDVYGDTTNSLTITQPDTTFVDLDSSRLRYSWVGIAGGAAL